MNNKIENISNSRSALTVHSENIPTYINTYIVIYFYNNQLFYAIQLKNQNHYKIGLKIKMTKVAIILLYKSATLMIKCLKYIFHTAELKVKLPTYPFMDL